MTYISMACLSSSELVDEIIKETRMTGTGASTGNTEMAPQRAYAFRSAESNELIRMHYI